MHNRSNWLTNITCNIIVACSFPPLSNNGVPYTTAKVFLYSDYVQYHCNEGYQYHPQTTSIIATCLSNGGWSPPPTCILKQEAKRKLCIVYNLNCTRWSSNKRKLYFKAVLLFWMQLKVVSVKRNRIIAISFYHYLPVSLGSWFKLTLFTLLG